MIRRNEENRQKEEGHVSCPSILILGVGNVLLSDEGVGVHVVNAMKDRNLPHDVELFDGGTAALDLLDVLADREKVIVIDAVKGGEEPGAIYRFTPSDVTTQGQLLTSIHQISMLETLTMAEHLGCTPREVIIFGIEPKEIDWGMELSPEVTKVVPRVIELVLSELGGEYA